MDNTCTIVHNLQFILSRKNNKKNIKTQSYHNAYDKNLINASEAKENKRTRFSFRF